MKTLSEKIIEQLQSKHDSFLGTEGEEERQRFKRGLLWAMDTVETLTDIDRCELESKPPTPSISAEEIKNRADELYPDMNEVHNMGRMGYKIGFKEGIAQSLQATPITEAEIDKQYPLNSNSVSTNRMNGLRRQGANYVLSRTQSVTPQAKGEDWDNNHDIHLPH